MDLLSLNYSGLIIAFSTLLFIGIGHIFVVKGEYYFSKKIWPLSLIIGLILIVLSFIVKSIIISGILGCISVTFFWAVHEFFKQEERVKKGWAKKNPKRKY